MPRQIPELSLAETIDVVTAALALGRSVTTPAEVVRHGPLWVLRDVNPKPGTARTEEVFAYGALPLEVVNALRDYAPSGHYALEPFVELNEDADATKAAYKALGFRLLRTEALFVCRLPPVPAPSPWMIRRVDSVEAMRAITAQVYGRASRKMRPEDFTSAIPAIRLYTVEVEGQAVAAARSLMALPTATWLADVATVPAFRRRGIARALLAHILAEDARFGARHSVLLATQSGALLYPHLGYERRGLLQIYSPPRGA